MNWNTIYPTVAENEVLTVPVRTTVIPGIYQYEIVGFYKDWFTIRGGGQMLCKESFVDWQWLDEGQALIPEECQACGEVSDPDLHSGCTHADDPKCKWHNPNFQNNSTT
jgi:hypothetical protein